MFLGAGPEAARFLKASDEIGLRKAGIKVLAAGSVLEQDQLDSIGAPTLGIVSTYHYSMVHDSALNRTFVKDFTAAAPPGLRPNFAAIQSYDALTAAYKVIAEQNGVVDPDKTMELVKQLKFESPRGPIEIDPATRDIVQNIYVRRVEKRGDLYVNTEFQTFPMVKGPGRALGGRDDGCIFAGKHRRCGRARRSHDAAHSQSLVRCCAQLADRPHAARPLDYG